MTVTTATVAAKKFGFGTCDCTDVSDAGTGDFLLMQGILQHVDMCM